MKIITPILLTFLLSLFCYTTSQAASPVTVTHVTLKELGSADLSLTGMYGTAVAWVPFQSDWRLEQPIKVTMAYIASPLLHQQRSTLTVLANGLEVTSLRPIADGAEHTFSFAIPSEQLQGAGLSLRFQGYLRLTNLNCEETNNPGQWLKILNKTDLEFASTLNEQSPRLSDLPQALVVQQAIDTPPPVVFVLPDHPDAVTLTAAARIAARLGQASGDDLFPFQAETSSTLTPAQRQEANLVLVGLPANQPFLNEVVAALPATAAKTGFITADNTIAPPEHGVIQIFNSPWNQARHVLLVSAAEEAGLDLAGQAFADELTFRSLHGSFEFVRGLEVGAVPQPGPAWLTPLTTFAQLGQADRTVSGPGLFHEYYYFRRPPGWVLDNGAQLSLHLAFSPALQASESYVAAFVNDVHVGTIRIGEGLKETQATFDLPIALLNETSQGARPQQLSLRLDVANFLLEKECEPAHPEAAWTQILADSAFITPHVYLALPDLQAFPYPFVSDQAGAPPVALIVPPQPNAPELSQALSLAATLGRFAPTDFNLRLLPADQATQASEGQAHLIVLGQRSRQPLLAEFLRAMAPIPGYHGEAGLYQALHISESGFLREAPSPWNAERVVLLVSAESAAGVANAAKALFNAAPPVTQPGSVALVEADQPPRIIYRSVEAAPDREPGLVLREPLLPRPQPWMVITLILGVATMAVVGTIGYSHYRTTRPRAD